MNRKKATKPKKKTPLSRLIRARSSVRPGRFAAPSKNGGVAGKLSWFFASNDGGEDKGLNDAGVVTYKGDTYRYLAREIIQNSLDARDSLKKPVIVTFDSDRLSRADLPGMDQLADVCKRCSDFWPRDPEKSFFQRAINLSLEPTIDALRISDFNTLGVTGDDEDRLKERGWYSLIRCSGSSSKEGGEGGSYGIGKNAPFAASSLQTVLYSTRTGKNDVAFVGVARLVTHEKSSSVKAQNIGFLGDKKGRSIRDAALVPNGFLRKEKGTDVIILGFKAGDTWEEQLRLSVLENFWPAIHFGDLEVQIGRLRITGKNLKSLLEESQKDELSAYHYYESFISDSATHLSAVLPILKDVELHLHSGEVELPKRVAMVRKSGMVIYHKQFRSVVPYCGVFVCRNEIGNSLLRAMESPRHDVWDANFPEKNANKHVEKEFIDYVKQSIRGLSVRDESLIIAVPEVSRFLPDDEELPDKSSGGPEQDHKDTIEGFPSRLATPKERKQLPVTIMPKNRSTASDGPNGASDEIDGILIDVTGGGIAKGPTDRDSSGSRGSTPLSTIPLQYRAFPKTPDGSEYAITVRSDSDKPQNAILTIQMVGDDSRAYVRLRGAQLANGKKIAFQPGGKVGPVTLNPGKPFRIHLVLEDAGKLAIEVTAHET